MSNNTSPTDPRREAFEKALDSLIGALTGRDIECDGVSTSARIAAVLRLYDEALEDARRLDAVGAAMGIAPERIRAAIDNGERMGLAFMRQSKMQSRAALYAGWTSIGGPFRPAAAASSTTDKGESNDSR